MKVVKCITLGLATLALASCQQPESEEAKPVAAPTSSPTASLSENEAGGAPASAPPSLERVSLDQLPLKPSSMCNVEALNGEPFDSAPLTTTAGSTLELSGWLGDEVTRGIPADSELRLEIKDDKTKAWRFPIQPGNAREDVVASSNEQGFRNSGFSVSIPTAELMPAVYHVYLSYTSGGERYVCDNGRYIELKSQDGS